MHLTKHHAPYSYNTFGRGYKHNQQHLAGVTTILNSTKSAEAQQFLNNYRKKTSQAAQQRNLDRGSQLHALLEGVLAGKSIDGYSSEVRSYYKSIYDGFLKQHQPTALLTEGFVWHPLGYGGSFDAVVRIDDELWLVDWKTSKSRRSGNILHDYKLQLAAYIGAFNHVYPDCKVKQAVLVVGFKASPAQTEWLYSDDILRYWADWVKRVKQYKILEQKKV